MVRITEDIKNRMIEMRTGGSTYSEICNELGVTKERCMAYLKDIKPVPAMMDAMTKEWLAAENEARGILTTMGFSMVHNLNEICSVIACWDYLAFRENRWWLIDVTINGQKSISAKRDVVVEEYNHAILLKTETEWKLIKLSMDVDSTIKI